MSTLQYVKIVLDFLLPTSIYKNLLAYMYKNKLSIEKNC